MHFGDYTFIFLLALVLFGPKKLPEIGRQIGRLMMEFRRASNEFKMQMDEELRNMDEQDRQKRLEASLQEQTDRVLAVAPQTEPLPADPGEIVQPLRQVSIEHDSEYRDEPYVAAMPPEYETEPDWSASEEPALETHSIHDVVKHPAPEAVSVREAESAHEAPNETPHEPQNEDSQEAAAALHTTLPEDPHEPHPPESDQAIRHV